MVMNNFNQLCADCLEPGGKHSLGSWDPDGAGVKEELGKAFRPEFLNRLDEVIVFESLNQDRIHEISVSGGGLYFF